ncbi:apolipoprotein N-acyltransferase [Alisedimentitalea sp. MJ-SS2]|uniref:apolipoprotein N-acyltransferase n=1 Tax=Aliisedimentitalea sp. MJ-SS2 TaxID=3049795 RepID=UPI0029126955|nr:apolipoprotein N-acyltransferase [Alisedimentitalea sp. MJ-SS2]MDU8925990.1 apolipoprotein N-acyltransferase [Alisedimentitalea sp. MJ-SS2]
MAEPDHRPYPVSRFEARAALLFLRRLMGLSALSGGLAALAHAPFYLWPLGLLGLTGMFALFRAASGPWPAFWIGWAGGTGYFAVALFWIVEPFFVDLTRHGWMAPFALIFLSGGLALFWGAASTLAYRLGRRPSGWIMALTGAELLRSYLLTGFPWALIGYVWTPSPAAHYASLIGPHGLTMAALIVAVTLWHLGTHARAKAMAMIALYGLLIGGGILLGRSPEPALDAPLIRMVQPNAPQHQKWDPDHVLRFFDRQLDYTARPGASRPPDLIVWPETAIPWLLDGADLALQQITRAAGETPVVLGLRRLEQQRLFNALIVLGPDGKVDARYDKHHLVPFGEYFPMGDLAAKFGIRGLAAGEGYGYSSGPGAQLISLPGIGDALPLICYEAVFPQDVRAAPSRPRLLLQLTNDAWFGQFSGPFQHLQQAQMRAIEQGLPMLRVANTGVSAMIDAKGRITRHIPLGSAGFADVTLPRALPPTIYARVGDWPVIGLVLIGLLACFLRRRNTAHRTPGADFG